MATMNVSLPDEMKLWVEERAQTGRFSNSSDYVRDLIRKDQERTEAIAHIQKLLDDGRASGISTLSREELLQEAKRRAAARMQKHAV